MFEKTIVQKGNKEYLFKEIEFYFYNKNHRDIITHPRFSKPLCWYVKDFGVIDLNFASSIKFETRPDSKGKIVKKYVLDDSACFGGILIRQLIEKESGDVLKGPWACAELFRCYDATCPDKSFPVLVEHDNGRVGNLFSKPRVNILRSHQKVEEKVNNILYEYHENVQPAKEILYDDFTYFKDKPYGYEKR